MKVLVLFGGVSPEHEVSLRSAEFVLRNLSREKYEIYPVGITKSGIWKYVPTEDYSAIAENRWETLPGVCRAVLSPSRGQGLVLFGEQTYQEIAIDCVFPVLHGENGEDGSVQGLMQVAGIPCVGCGVAASAAGMDKTLTKLLVAETGVRQANWYLARRESILNHIDRLTAEIEQGGDYPLFVKPAGTGSSVGVSKVLCTDELKEALQKAAEYDSKVLIEEYIPGREVELAVLGNGDPIVSQPGEILPGAEFYDYDAKYNSTESRTVIPADLPDDVVKRLQDAAVSVYKAVGCSGLTRCDFFVRDGDQGVVFNEVNTIPGFTAISMYPKLMEYKGIPGGVLMDELIRYALEMFQEREEVKHG